MTDAQAVTALWAALGGWVTAGLLLTLRLKAPPGSSLRTNYAGRPVPVVGGGPLVASALIVMLGLLAFGAGGWRAARTEEIGAAVALLLVAMFLAGEWDDRRGDERPRGFKGHLSAGRGGRLTGGIVKAVTGGASGLAAGALLDDDLYGVVSIALVVALTANLVNLTDRAPGRAGKVTLLIALPAAAFAPGEWTVAAAGLIGALVGCLPPDLSERVMLGDAGANPLGAVAGLGLALALPPVGRAVGVMVLLALNLASERWSFSRAIDRFAWLRALDRLGRQPPQPVE